MKLVFNLGFGFMSRLYIKGLPTPAMWVKDKYVEYVFDLKPQYDNTHDAFRDAFKRATYGVKRL